MRRLIALAAALGAAVVLASPSGAGAAQSRVSAFFYPWYGTPARDGRWLHWSQRGARPPTSIASGFWPARGLYSSADPSVLAAQMSELRAAGVDQVVVSWWGRGSAEDRRLIPVAVAARARGLTVAAHVEPYGGRTPASVAADARYLRALGIDELFVYGPADAEPDAWAAALGAVPGRVFAQTHLVGFAARGRFEGIYTYDVLVWGADKFARLCAQARRARIACAPSVGPGYDARRAVGDRRIKPRRNGRTYDTMWRAAIRARADRVTITSYNEWHEGTQIEPARPRQVRGVRFRGYGGAWGLRGRPAERAYLSRTALWAERFRARTRRAGARRAAARQYNVLASRRR